VRVLANEEKQNNGLWVCGCVVSLLTSKTPPLSPLFTHHLPPPPHTQHTPLHTHPGLWSIEMPNSWNFGWSYYVINILIMLTYIPGTTSADVSGIL
jgi:hypothetical protein